MASRKLNQLAAASAAFQATHSAALAAPVDTRTPNQQAAAKAQTPEQLAKMLKSNAKAAKAQGKIASVANTSNVAHIGPKIADNKKAQIEGAKRDGAALGELTIQTAREEGQKWKPIMQSIFDRVSDKAYQTAYRKTLSDARKNENELHRYEAADPTLGTPFKPQNAMLGQLTRSTFTRLSELTTLSRACEAGFTQAAMREIWAAAMPGADNTFEKMSAASIFRAARMYLASDAARKADGNINQDKPGAARGRQAKPAIEKVKTFILANVHAADLPGIAAMLDAMAKRIKTDAQLAKEKAAVGKPITVKVEKRATVRLAA